MARPELTHGHCPLEDRSVESVFSNYLLDAEDREWDSDPELIVINSETGSAIQLTDFYVQEDPHKSTEMFRKILKPMLDTLDRVLFYAEGRGEIVDMQQEDHAEIERRIKKEGVQHRLEFKTATILSPDYCAMALKERSGAQPIGSEWARIIEGDDIYNVETPTGMAYAMIRKEMGW